MALALAWQGLELRNAKQKQRATSDFVASEESEEDTGAVVQVSGESDAVQTSLIPSNEVTQGKDSQNDDGECSPIDLPDDDAELSPIDLPDISASEPARPVSDSTGRVTNSTEPWGLLPLPQAPDGFWGRTHKLLTDEGLWGKVADMSEPGAAAPDKAKASQHDTQVAEIIEDVTRSVAMRSSPLAQICRAPGLAPVLGSVMPELALTRGGSKMPGVVLGSDGAWDLRAAIWGLNLEEGLARAVVKKRMRACEEAQASKKPKLDEGVANSAPQKGRGNFMKRGVATHNMEHCAAMESLTILHGSALTLEKTIHRSVTCSAPKAQETARAQDFTARKDLSLCSRGVQYSLYEYSEPRPFMLGCVGMAHRVLEYHSGTQSNEKRQPILGPLQGAYQHPLQHKTPVPDILKGQVCLPKNRSGLAVMESTMVRAPIFRHNVRAQDFLLVCRSLGKGVIKLCLQKPGVAFTVGQTEPLMQVCVPGKGKADLLKKNCVRQMIRKGRVNLLQKGPVDRGSKEDVRLCKNVQRWNPKSGSGLISWLNNQERKVMSPDSGGIATLVLPEEMCMLKSMQQGSARLKALGISNVSFDSALQSRADEFLEMVKTSHATKATSGDGTLDHHKLVRKVRWILEELQLTPWHISSEHALASTSRPFAVAGFGDPLGARSEGVSFLTFAPKDFEKYAELFELEKTLDDGKLLQRLLAQKMKRREDEELARQLCWWERLCWLQEKMDEKKAVGGEMVESLFREKQDRRSLREKLEAHRRLLQEAFDGQVAALSSSSAASHKRLAQRQSGRQDIANSTGSDDVELAGLRSLLQAAPDKTAGSATLPKTRVLLATTVEKNLLGQPVERRMWAVGEAHITKYQEMLARGQEEQRDELAAKEMAAAHKTKQEVEARAKGMRERKFVKLEKKAFGRRKMTDAPFIAIASGKVDRLGLGLQKKPNKSRVRVNVQEKSWASRAGIINDSEVVAINGVDVANMDAPAFHKHMSHRPLRLAVSLRKAKTLNIQKSDA